MRQDAELERKTQEAEDLRREMTGVRREVTGVRRELEGTRRELEVSPLAKEAGGGHWSPHCYCQGGHGGGVPGLLQSFATRAVLAHSNLSQYIHVPIL